MNHSLGTQPHDKTQMQKLDISSSQTKNWEQTLQVTLEWSIYVNSLNQTSLM